MWRGVCIQPGNVFRVCAPAGVAIVSGSPGFSLFQCLAFFLENILSTYTESVYHDLDECLKTTQVSLGHVGCTFQWSFFTWYVCNL